MKCKKNETSNFCAVRVFIKWSLFSVDQSGPSINTVEAKNQRNLEKSAPPLPSTPPPTSAKSRNGEGLNSVDDLLGGNDDPFFDDLVPSGGGLHSFGNR